MGINWKTSIVLEKIKPIQYGFQKLRLHPTRDVQTSTKESRARKHIRRIAAIFSRFKSSPWLVEIASCVLALASLAAIVLVLAIHRDQPLPSWPLGISVNALISIFTKILTATLLLPVAEGISQLKWLWFCEPRPLNEVEGFDNASRGPWGSLRFMVEPRKHYLATFGAFIIVASLAIDPFSQQILQYYSCSQVVTTSVAQLPRSNNYTDAGVHQGPLQYVLGSSMSAAIYVGILSPPANASSAVPFTCPTGNCTFPTNTGASLSTIGMCSSCVDITDSVDNTTEEYKFSLPSGLTAGQGLMMATGNSRGYEAQELYTFDTLMLGWENASCTTGCAYRPIAFSCSLFPCIKTYESTIANGILDEKLVSTTPLAWTSYYHPEYSIATNTTLRNGTWQDCQPTDQQTDANSVPVSVNQTAYTGTYEAYGNISKWYPDDCTWYLDSGTTLGIKGFMYDLYENQSLDSSYGLPDDTEGPLWLTDLYVSGQANLTSVQRYMTGITDSMTATMRQQSTDPNNSTYQVSRASTSSVTGSVLGLETCIRVNWLWIILPACLPFLAILFLITTIHLSSASKTKTLRPGIWKSSSLALLYQGLEKDTAAQIYGNLQNGEDLLDSARRIRVKYTQVGQSTSTWRFVEQSGWD